MAQIVEKVRSGDTEERKVGMERLAEVYLIVTKIYISKNHLAKRYQKAFVDDWIQDGYVAVLEGIQNRLREPEALYAYIWGVLKNVEIVLSQNGVINSHKGTNARKTPFKHISIDDPVGASSGMKLVQKHGDVPNPETIYARKELQEKMRSVASGMRGVRHHLFIHGVLEEEPQQKSMELLNITDTQYRIEKNRAKTEVITRMKAMVAAA